MNVPLLALSLSLAVPASEVGASADRPGADRDPSDRAAKAALYDFGAAREALTRSSAPGATEAPSASRRPDLAGAGQVVADSEAYVVPASDAQAHLERSLELRRAPRLRPTQREALDELRDRLGSTPLASVATPWRTASSALRTEYVVDDDGGPGVDFLEIGDAVAVAAAGDLITVRPGVYEEFILRTGVTILGESGPDFPFWPIVQSSPHSSAVEFISSGQRVVISGLRFSWRPLVIRTCFGTVVVEGGSALGLDVRNSLDVRVHGAHLQRTVQNLNSRIEFVDCELDGDGGLYAYCEYEYVATPGLPAQHVQQGRAHLVGCDVQGGAGGDGDCYWLQCSDCRPPEVGGPGLFVDSGYVIVAGESVDLVDGGDGGYMLGGGPSGYYGVHADDGPGARIHPAGTLRASGVTIDGIDNLGGQLVLPSEPDPTLELVGDPAPGEQLSLVVRGAPGGATRLYFSRTPIVQGNPGAGIIERLVPFDVGVDLGNMPAGGVATFDWTIPPTPPRDGPVFGAWLAPRAGPLRGRYPRGTVLFVQATVFTDGSSRRTNSVPIIIR